MKPRYKPRISLKSPAVFAVKGVIGQGRVLNLTNPGCLIESSVVVKQGDYLNLKLLLGGLKSPLLVTGGAVRWTNGVQFGVEFIEMTEAERLKLDHFLSHHMRGSAAPARTTRFSEPGGHNWHLKVHSQGKEKEK
jgi:hypothetical protein